MGDRDWRRATGEFGAVAIDPTMRPEASVSIADVLKVTRSELVGTSAAGEADRLAGPSTKVRRSMLQFSKPEASASCRKARS